MDTIPGLGVYNIFFPECLEDKDIRQLIRKNIDICKAFRMLGDEVIEGKVVLCVDDEEIDKVTKMVEDSKDFYIAGEDEATLWHTTISVESLVIDTY